MGHPAPFHLKMVGIGNENWGCGGQMTAEHSTNLYRNFAEFVRAPRGNRPVKVAAGPNAGLQRPDFVAGATVSARAMRAAVFDAARLVLRAQIAVVQHLNAVTEHRHHQQPKHIVNHRGSQDDVPFGRLRLAKVFQDSRGDTGSGRAQDASNEPMRDPRSGGLEVQTGCEACRHGSHDSRTRNQQRGSGDAY